jgi:PilZ domain
MPETNKARFLSVAFELELDGLVFGMRGLISTLGATQIRVDADVADGVGLALGRLATIRIGSVSVKGVLTRLFTREGVTYEVRFRNVEGEQLEFLEKLIAAEGVQPGWIRRYPRIPVKQAEAADLPVFTLCMLRFGQEEVVAPVLNFSLGGLRFEIAGDDSLRGLQVGSTVQFDLMDNTGSMLPGFSGEVRNLAVTEAVQGDAKEVVRTVGISFIAMNPGMRKKYLGLIREFCDILVRRRQESP